uniref:Uncharacterized protein n=1 Tax=Streptomyces sp. NBC_01401 TaxID=2903854 RepID=A0AAU3GWG1_9ACTN
MGPFDEDVADLRVPASGPDVGGSEAAMFVATGPGHSTVTPMPCGARYGRVPPMELDPDLCPDDPEDSEDG